jgi:hypothetical protein
MTKFNANPICPLYSTSTEESMDSTENFKAKSMKLKEMVEKRDVSIHSCRFISASLSYMGY